MLADGSEESAKMPLCPSCWRAEKSGIALTGGHLAGDAGLLEQHRGRADRQYCFAMTILILQELQGLSIGRQYPDRLFAIGQYEGIEQH